jgi:ectoine hydroxylase-related dioxygenase (phytanoyl-CoA dioxygenase family)
MGTMQFVRGSHRMENIVPKQIGSESEPYYEKIISKNSLDIDSFDLETGDATFHSGRTLHCAHGNITDKNREVITIIYV